MDNASASEAGDHGFESHRARFLFGVPPLLLGCVVFGVVFGFGLFFWFFLLLFCLSGCGVGLWRIRWDSNLRPVEISPVSFPFFSVTSLGYSACLRTQLTVLDSIEDILTKRRQAVK